MFDWFKNIFSNFTFFNSDIEDQANEILDQDQWDGFEKHKQALASDWKAIGNDFKKVIK